MLNNEQSKTDQNRKESYIIAYGSAICLVVVILYMTLIYTPEVRQAKINDKQTIDSLQHENDSLKIVHKVNGWGIIRDNGTSREIYNTILDDKKERVKLYKN
jgi:hypothetical protein